MRWSRSNFLSLAQTVHAESRARVHQWTLSIAQNWNWRHLMIAISVRCMRWSTEPLLIFFLGHSTYQWYENATYNYRPLTVLVSCIRILSLPNYNCIPLAVHVGYLFSIWLILIGIENVWPTRKFKCSTAKRAIRSRRNLDCSMEKKQFKPSDHSCSRDLIWERCSRDAVTEPV